MRKTTRSQTVSAPNADMTTEPVLQSRKFAITERPTEDGADVTGMITARTAVSISTPERITDPDIPNGSDAAGMNTVPTAMRFCGSVQITERTVTANGNMTAVPIIADVTPAKNVVKELIPMKSIRPVPDMFPMEIPGIRCRNSVPYVIPWSVPHMKAII